MSYPISSAWGTFDRSVLFLFPIRYLEFRKTIVLENRTELDRAERVFGSVLGLGFPSHSPIFCHYGYTFVIPRDGARELAGSALVFAD